MDEFPQTKELFNQLTLGVVKSLEMRLGICDVKLHDTQPAERHQVVSWEQRNSCMLPDDLKRFYLTSDGLLLKWNVRYDDQLQQVGRMEINKINTLTKLAGSKTTSNINTPSLANVDYVSDDDEESGDEHTSHPMPHFDTRSRVFELDSCEGSAKVCLVYRNTKPGTPAQNPEIWFLDRAFRWHFLADTFSQYFRMMLMHLGLPQWQYAFTDIGLSPQAKQWFNIYSPLRIRLDDEDESISDNSWNIPKGTSQDYSADFNKLDVGRVFKGKIDKKLKSLQSKKKYGSNSKPLSGSSNSRSGSQLGGGRFR